MAKTKAFRDIVEVLALRNHPARENGTILAEEVFRVHSDHPVECNLEITDCHPKTFCHTIHHKPLITSNHEDVPTVPIDDVISFSVKPAIGN